MTEPHRFERPPGWFWLIPAVAVTLRLLPYAWLQWVPPPDGAAYIGVSYLPIDFLAYLGFIRQTADDGALLLANPFTTDPQSPRYILLFHSLVGVVAGVTGIEPLTAFELSRIPLTFLLFATLWWFLQPFLPDRRVRVWAVLLAAFAGGLETWAHLIWPLEPATMWQQPHSDTASLVGWSLFGSLFNPLWVAALIVLLVVLRPLLVVTASRPLWPAALLFLLYCVHPYTAIGALAIVAMVPVCELIAGAGPEWRGTTLYRGAVLGGGLAVILVVNFWQSGDAVFRVTAGGLWGPKDVPVFWYPLTLGVLGVLALIGATRGLLAPRQRPAVYAWLAGVILLHTSPLLNGCKFVFLLHLPLCILAAPVAADYFGPAMAAGGRRRALAVLAGVGLFAGCVLQTVEDVRITVAKNLLGVDEKGVVETLSGLPAGNAFVHPALGNQVPAFGPHRVWVGQWFLTPDFEQRAVMYARLAAQPDLEPGLRTLVHDAHIRYVIVRSDQADAVAREIAPARRLPHGFLELLVLD